jgi:hypothetical protein
MSSNPTGAFAAASAAIGALAWPEPDKAPSAQERDRDSRDSAAGATVASIVDRGARSGAAGSLGAAA